jgi:hypothetical protein
MRKRKRNNTNEKKDPWVPRLARSVRSFCLFAFPDYPQTNGAHSTTSCFARGCGEVYDYGINRCATV